MPCIIFSVHLRQQAAHYLHSTQISGLVSAGISFRPEWICLLSKGRACHTHLLKGVTLKRACVCVVAPLHTVIYLNLSYMEKKKKKSRGKKVKESQGWERNLESFNCRFDHFLPEQHPIKTEVSAYFCCALSVIFCRAAAWRRDVWCCSSKMTSGKQLTLKFDFLTLPSLSTSLAFTNEMIGALLFQQIPKSPKAVTPPPQGDLGGLSEREEDAHLW